MEDKGILTQEIKQAIDAMSYEDMLRLWRFAEVGSPHFIGDRGQYFSKVMAEKRDANPTEAILASKRIGWTR